VSSRDDERLRTRDPGSRALEPRWREPVRLWLRASLLVVLLIFGGVVLWFAVDETVLRLLGD
jgi:hypothetical protein